MLQTTKVQSTVAETPRDAEQQSTSENDALRQELAEAQAKIRELESEQKRLQAELNEIKQAPFKDKRRRKSTKKDEPAVPHKKSGRRKGHVGSGRKRPTRIDRTERLEIGPICPDCKSILTGKIIERERVVEDIELSRATVVTHYTIERCWCSVCQAFKELPVLSALPNMRLGLNVMLFVVYQKVALGLSYGKIRRELTIYFGLQVSRGTLVNIVAKVSSIFGPAYKRLIDVMRQQAAIHIDETSWRVDGKTQ